jgi:chromosome segregation protein
VDEPRRDSPRLKALELQGYKTFAGKAEFQFGRTITAIVGPNGSGKSNIADAIRWVLGEQSYGLLRGKKTEDMIFAGSETRPRASMASATITFDNGDGWLPIEFTEVSIARRAYRDAQNEYFLNAQRVRLREVSELLSETGLGQRTYTIIGQGLVDAVLALKAEERRRLFEEAAGIGLYRSRREEAFRRLEATRRNLERVQDILAELLPRVRSLERQARRAHEYEQVRDDLKSALRTWYGFHWFRVQKLVAEAHAEAGQQAQRRDELRLEQDGLDASLVQVRGRIDVLRAELHTLSQRMSSRFAERETLGRRVAVAQERLRGLAEQEAESQAETAQLQAERDELAGRLESSRQEAAGRQQTLLAAEEEYHRLRGPAELAGLDRDELQARLSEVRAGLEAVLTRRSEWRSELAQADARLQSLAGQAVETRLAQESAVRALESARGQADGERHVVEQAERALQAARESEAGVRQDIARLEQSLADGRDMLRQVESRQAALEARRGVLLEEARRQQRARARLGQAIRDGEVAGSLGRLSERLHPAADLQRAVMAALGEAAQGFVFESPEDVESALAWLAESPRAGRVSLIPQRVRQPARPRLAFDDPACLGNAAELARADVSVQPAVDHLLGSMVIVRTRDDARRIAGTLPPGGRAVALGGEVYSAGGEVVAGVAEEDRPSEALGQVEDELRVAAGERQQRAGEVDGLAGELQALVERLAEAGRTVGEAGELDRRTRLRLEQTLLDQRAQEARVESLAAAGVRLSQDVGRLERERGECEARGVDLQAEEAGRQAEADALALRLTGGEGAALLLQLEANVGLARTAAGEAAARTAEAEARLAILEADLEQRRQRAIARGAAEGAARRDLTEADAGLKAIEASLSAMQAESDGLEAQLRQLEAERAEHETGEARSRSELQDSERAHSQAQIELARRQQELTSLQQRIEDDFGLVAFEYEESVTGPEPLPLTGWVETLPRVDEVAPELEGQVARLRLQLRRMGAVNVEARREYEEVRQRADFLTAQVDDLRKAEAQIQEVIAELDHLMEREFRKTFDAVAITFRQVFTRLFGGGSAKLVLTDSDDLMNTGIDVEARLPGRREHGLAMLSGGERSLTACALVFSLLKVSPTPFCVLDEVDAMLDEANVGRFCEMLRELSSDTQFLIITHNRQTIQTAEVVYGVSMGADSASRVLSLRLDEAEKAAAR